MNLFITHVDLDGVGSPIVNKVLQIEFDKTNYTNYGDKNELDFLSELDENSTVTYADFSPNEEARKIIADRKAKCKIYDHHIAVKEEIETWMKEYHFVEYIFDNERSGTKIYYDSIKDDYLKNQTLEEFVNLVSTYDLYQKDSPYWEEADKLNRCMFKSLTFYKEGEEKFEQFIKTQVYKCEHFDHFSFTDWEIAKVTKDIQEENELFLEIIRGGKSTMKTRKDSDGNYFVVVQLNKKISSIASKILEKYKGLKYVIVINTYKSDDWKVSIRSREGFDLLQFEGCKGHSEACGIENCTHEFANSIWEGKTYSLKKKIQEAL